MSRSRRTAEASEEENYNLNRTLEILIKIREIGNFDTPNEDTSKVSQSTSIPTPKVGTERRNDTLQDVGLTNSLKSKQPKLSL